MANEGLSEEELFNLEKTLLDQVPEVGKAIGNTMLRERLEWSEDQYWTVRARLLERGLLEVGRGRGGSVRRPFQHIQSQPLGNNIKPTQTQVFAPDDVAETYAEVLEIVKEEAERHGVGFVVMGQAGNYETWDEQVEAVRQEPDPEKLNDFLAKQLSTTFKEQIAKWFR
jgi:hypothetical protein